MLKNIMQNDSGMAALFTIIIIGAAALIMAKSVTIITMSEMDIGLASSKGEEAYYLAEGCAEESMRRIRLDNDYEINNFVLPVGNGSCIINVSSSGNNKDIVIISSVENYYKKFNINLTLVDGAININNWEEIEN